MGNPALIEGRTGTLPDGTRVVVRGGKLAVVDAGGSAAVAPPMVDSKVDQEAIQAQRDKAAKSLDTATQAGRFVSLNKNMGTGGMSSNPIVPLPKFMGQVPSWGGTLAAMTGNPDWQTMKSITSAVAPGLRPPGSGSSSDTDVKFYTQGFPNVENIGPANQKIQQRLQADSNRENARAAYMQKWFSQKGSLLGADQSFNGWWATQGAPNFDHTRGDTHPLAPRPKAAPRPASKAQPNELHFDAQGNLLQ